MVDVITAFNPHVVDPHLRVGALLASQPGQGQAIHRRGNHRRSSGVPRSARRSSRSSTAAARRSTGGLPRRPDPAARDHAASPDVRVRPHADRHREHRRVGRPPAPASPSAHCAWLRSSARTSPARSVACCASRSCRSACSPTRRSPSWRTSTPLGRSWPRPAGGWTEPVNVVAPGAVTGLQAIMRGRRVPLAVLGPEWAFVAPAEPRPRRSHPRSRAGADASRTPCRREPQSGAARDHPAQPRPPR